MDKLLEEIKILEKLLNEKFPVETFREKLYGRTVKLSEEVGELCSEVLSSTKDQRKEKLEIHSEESLNDEFADVLITTLILAQTMNVDIRKALKNKITKIKSKLL